MTTPMSKIMQLTSVHMFIHLPKLYWGYRKSLLGFGRQSSLETMKCGFNLEALGWEWSVSCFMEKVNRSKKMLDMGIARGQAVQLQEPDNILDTGRNDLKVKIDTEENPRADARDDISS